MKRVMLKISILEKSNRLLLTDDDVDEDEDEVDEDDNESEAEDDENEAG